MTRWLRLTALWMAAIAIAGGVAFFGVALALRRDDAPSTVSVRLHDARRIEAFAVELRALLDAMSAPAPGSPSAALRIDELRPKVREKQQKILRTKLSGPSYNALLTAADRLAALTAGPANPSLYDAARKAQNELEAQVRVELRALEKESTHKRGP